MLAAVCLAEKLTALRGAIAARHAVSCPGLDAADRSCYLSACVHFVAHSPAATSTPPQQPIPSVPEPVDPEQEAQLDRELQELRDKVQQVCVGVHV